MAVLLLDEVANIRFEPRLLRRTASALIDQVPAIPHPGPLPEGEGVLETINHEAARLLELLFVLRYLRHGHWDAVRGKNHQSVVAALRRNLLQCCLRGLDHRLDEYGMVEERPQLVDLRGRRTNLLLRAGN